MRRFVLVAIMILLALTWIIPASAQQVTGSPPWSYKPVAERKNQPTKKKSPTPTPRHTKKHKKHRKPTPRPTAKPRQKSTPKPKPTNTTVAKPTSTATPTATATVTPTVTLTPTPAPLQAALQLRAYLPTGFSAGFYVCGLPSGVSAVFLPNPVAADTSDGISSAATGQSEVTLSVPYTVARSSYGLAFYASYKNVGGVTVGGIPGGGVDPQFAVLNVQANSVSLQPAAAIPADAGQGCSPIPAGYQPPLQPTPSPSSYALNTWVSDPHPAAGETVSVYAQLSLDGRPIGGAPITFTWYSFGVTRAPCYAVTDSSGTTSCSVVNSYPLPGVPVSIQVSTNYNGYFLSSWTSYTM